MTAGRLWTLTILICAALLATLVFAALRLGWHIGGHTAQMPIALSAPRVDTGPDEQRDLVAITALAPFGQTTALEPTAQTTPAVARINLVLRGVLVDPDPSQSRAFVAADGTTGVYRVGEIIAAAELVAINADTITLQTADGLKVVGFDGILGDPETAEADETTAQDLTDDPLSRLAAALVPGNGSIDLRDAPEPESTGDYINLWRDRITQNPQAAMDRVGVEVVENGYRIKPDPNIGVTLAGLRPGDVVTRLNGQAVGDLDNDRQLYDEAAAAGIVRLEVVRDGQALLLTFPLR